MSVHPAMLELAPGAGRTAGAERESSWPTRLLLALFAAGVACDTVIGPLLGAHGAASVVASAALGAPLVVAAGWRLLRDFRIRPVSAPIGALLAFTLWTATTLLWAASPDEVITRSVTNAQLFVSVWLGWQVIRTERDLRALLAGYVAGGLVIVWLAWQSYQAGEAAVDQRFVAGAYDPNDMALYLVIGIPMAAYLGLARGRRLDLVAMLYVPAAVVGIALTGSRAGLLAGAVALAAVGAWVAATNRGGLVVMLVLVGAGAAFATAWLTPEVLERLFTLDEELAGGSVGDRARIWRAGLEVLQRHPAIGIGGGGFANAVATRLQGGIVAHNTPLSLAVEVGAIGLVLFASSIVFLLRGVGRSGHAEKALAWALVLAWTVGSSSLSWEFRKPTWFILLVGAALGTIRPRPRAAAAARAG